MDAAGNLGSATETRKGTMPVSTMVEESFTAEMKPTSATAEAGGGGGGKTGKSNDEGKTQKVKSGRKKKAKTSRTKTSKKKLSGAQDVSSSSDSEAVEHTADSTSDDSDDSSAGSDSEISSDSEPEVEVVKKPKGLKKRQYPKKAKSTKSSSKKSKKQRKVRTEIDSDDSDLDDADSDLDHDDDSEMDNARGGQKSSTLATISQQLQQVSQLQLKQQQQLEQLQRIITTSGLGMGNAGLYNPLALNPGLLNQGLLGSNSAVGGLAGLGQQQVTGGINGRGGAGGAGRAPPPGGRVRMGHRSTRDDISVDGDEDDVIEDDTVGNPSRSNPFLANANRRNTATASSKKSPKLEFKRVDQVWDSQIHNYKLQDTAKNTSDSHYSEYIFHVRRTFDWENKFKATVVDIKSKKLRECLQEVIGTIKGVSLVEETPKLDPNTLFLYLEDLREHLRKLKSVTFEAKNKKERKKKQTWLDDKRSHLKVLLKYLDKDYAHIKKSLYPLLENGLITFDLLWALWKPNTLVFTTTYGTPEEHRVFKAEFAEKRYSMLKGETYYIEGKYFEYDGKNFGFGVMAEEMAEFQGSRRIDSLACYPLCYHKNEAQVRRDLVERGKKFASLGGMLFRSHQGLAYYKKKKSVVRVEVNSRIMVDPASHRRYNPNYPLTVVRPKVQVCECETDSEEEEEDDSDDDDAERHDGGLVNGALQLAISSHEGGEEKVKMVTKYIMNKHGELEVHKMPADEVENFLAANGQLDMVEGKGDQQDGTAKKDVIGKAAAATTTAAAKVPKFSDEEYLIASPVVLGFAFGEKLWLEFTVSGIKDIVWNEHAYDSLVREPNKKEIVQALVESHKYHPTESIDDVIQGKGKGLVAVLHGPPGTGKTLTAEGISELLRCPLYNVSAGDLGTDSRYLEAELQKTLDICHAWGAILLLDEADVFLEKRNMADIHRNALVSIFLRQLEYFQGILFLTTNRVESFDEAFLSRMHIPLRYDELDAKARKAVFRMFIERVRSNETELHGREAGAGKVAVFTDEHYSELSRYSLNGRQIKNTVITAHRVARQKGEPLGMRQIKSYLGIVTDFERDLKGGPGHEASHTYM
ncbi:ATPase family AAA domain-containing protein 3A-like [Apiospora kogelbergensis]|uniref:ATPase family AAA domain-containing protein 3A-like n=1 Tax=Apiospora kogelbergensis TaxID=1337665 RepID=A0AAW0QHF6_9PEZI